jgi:hypothetical protein
VAVLMSITPKTRSSTEATNLVAHELRRTYSFSKPHVPSTRPPSPQSQDNILESSASSVVDHDGILVQDVDAEVDGEDINAIGVVSTAAGNEDSKKLLREQLRNTLSSSGPTFITINCVSLLTVTRYPLVALSEEKHRTRNPGNRDLSEQVHSPRLILAQFSVSPGPRYPPRDYFVLTDAGKPVFATCVMLFCIYS